MSVRIEYGDYAVGAKEAFEPSSDDELVGVSNIEQIKSGNAYTKNYGNPTELYSVLLDGDTMPLKDEMTSRDVVGFWSGEITDENGDFADPIVISVEDPTGEKYTSNSVSLTFDVNTGIFPNDVSVAWYRGGEVISEKRFYPDAERYVFNNKVDAYDKVVFTFYSLNMPYNRLKVRNIEYGDTVIFSGSSLRQCRITQKTNPLSTEIPIGTGDFEIISENGLVFSFQTRQPLSIKYKNGLQAYVFVKSANRKNKNTWSVKAEDYIGVLDTIQFYGGIYNDVDAVDLLEQIFKAANVPYEIDTIFEGMALSGHIPSGSCRDALMQVCFAIGASVSTANSSVVKVLKIEALDVVSYFSARNVVEAQRIEEDRVLQGQTIDEKAKVTRVSVSYHAYRPTNEEFAAYKSSESSSGEGIVVKFNEPLHSLRYEGNGEIISSGANYALVNAEEDFILYGKKYEHTVGIKTISTALASSSDAENEVSVEEATLVSASNVDNVLQRCYNYYSNVRNVKSKIVENAEDDAVSVGSVITVPTEYAGDITGIVESVSFSLNGARLAKDTVLRKINIGE